jgi:hypothetical protein
MPQMYEITAAADLVIVELADSEVRLLERLAVVEADCRVWRELAHAALAQLADLQVRHKNLTTRHERLHDEYRAQRAQTMLKALRGVA